MSSIPLPALNIRPPEQPDVAQSMGNLMRLKLMMGQQQLLPGQIEAQQQQLQSGRLDLQMKQEQMKTMQAFSRSMLEAHQGGPSDKETPTVPAQAQPAGVTPSSIGTAQTAPSTAVEQPSQKKGFDIDAIIQRAIDLGGNPQLLMPYAENYYKFVNEKAKAGAAQIDLENKQLERAFGAIQSVTTAAPENKPAAWQSAAQVLQPLASQYKVPLPLNYPGDQAMPEVMARLGLYKQALADAKEKQGMEETSWRITGEKAKYGPLSPDTINQLNAGMLARIRVMNPGAKDAGTFSLRPGATQEDFNRLDKLLQQTESSQATKAMRDQTAAFREQTLSMQKEAQAIRMESPVIGQDPKTGQDVLVSHAEAKNLGLVGVLKVGEQEVGKAVSARHWIPLAGEKAPAGASPDQKGILQLIDELDAKGKLGPLASRWNEFMAGKIGAGDPDVEALRTKMGLSSTLLMNAHVGSRGGSYMLEHFEDLANQKKMDANTLRSGVASELHYIKQRAMLPATGEQGGPAGPAARPSGPPPGATHIAPGSDGKRHYTNAQGQDLGIAP